MASTNKSTRDPASGERARGAGRTIAKTARRLVRGAEPGADERQNRTGVGASPDLAREMIEGVAGEPTRKKNGALEFRRGYMAEGEPIATAPQPVSIVGVVEGVLPASIDVAGPRATVFLDRLGERLAFERTGTRLYEQLLVKLDGYGSFAGGPSRRDLQKIRDEEHQHLLLLKGCIETLGADPTAVTPSANLAGVEGMGLVQAIGDARTTLGQGLHAILVAEAVDVAAWELLIGLAQGLGQAELVERFGAAALEEESHLTRVKAWVAAHAESLASDEA